MKKLYPYNIFVYEGIRDSMTPKSEEELKNIDLDKFNPLNLFHKGIQNGLVWLVKKSIEKDPKIIKTEKLGIVDAINNNDYEMVKFLIDMGMNFNALNIEELIKTPIRNKNLEIVKLIIDSGVDSHHHNDYFLRLALEVGADDIIETLLEQGLKIPHPWMGETYIEAQKKLLEYYKRKYEKVKNEEKDKLKKQINEGVRDKMTGKTERLEEWYRQDADEVVRRFEEAFPLIKITEVRVYRSQLLLAIVIEPIKFTEHDKIKEWFVKNTNYIVDGFKKSFNNTIFIDIDKKSLRKTNESVRDKMTPRPKRDILKNLKNVDREDLDEQMVQLCQEYFEDDAEKLAEFVETKIAPDIWTRSMFEEEKKYKEFNNITKRKRIIKNMNTKNIFIDTIFCLTEDELMKMFSLLYDLNITESVRDKMTPKSKEDIKQSILKTKGDLSYIKISNLNNHFTDEEFREILINLPTDMKLKVGCYGGHLWLVKQSLEEKVNPDLYNFGLYLAAGNDKTEVVKYLLSIGIAKNPKVDLLDAARIARDNFHTDMEKLIMGYKKTNKI